MRFPSCWRHMISFFQDNSPFGHRGSLAVAQRVGQGKAESFTINETGNLTGQGISKSFE